MLGICHFPLVVATVSVPVVMLLCLFAAALGAGAAIVISRSLGEKTLAAGRAEAKQLTESARAEADQLTESARREAESTRKQAELEARNEQIAKREALEKESNEARSELKETERRLTKREDNLDRKMDVLTTKEKQLDEREEQLKAREQEEQSREAEAQQFLEQQADQLNTREQEAQSKEEQARQALEQQEEQLKAREQEVEAREKEADKADEKQREQLMNIANLSEEQARKIVLKRVEEEVQHEAGQIIQREMTKAEEEAKDNARKITLQAIQRFAAEHTAASTVTTVNITSDDMKGRVIGREGRNIRAFEQATGVDVIVDDTPGVVVVSCFDPVRRAVASEALDRLIEDGRIHPARIEEMVDQLNVEVLERIVKYGKDACIEANVQGVHPKVSEMMGRLQYRTSYGQNILRHSIETAYLCQVMADELGLDGALARRCGFFHDIGKAMDHEVEGGHPEIGMEFARKHKERDEVLNAIGGHHGDIDPTSPYTPIVMAADAISGARPGARRETLERYIKRLEQLEGIATSYQGVREAYAIQAGREVRVIVDSKRIDDATSAKIARDIAKRVEEEMTYPGEVRITVLREMRAVEYAR